MFEHDTNTYYKVCTKYYLADDVFMWKECNDKLRKIWLDEHGKKVRKRIREESKRRWKESHTGGYKGPFDGYVSHKDLLKID